ncbi:MAG TPA: methyltransferase [Gemmatimonadales bacterium]|nr:methyltransferase [Gemmatimonadales bacterium]
MGLLLQRLAPIRLPEGPALRIAGGALIVIGLALSGAVVYHFGRAGTPVTPLRATRRLVVSGPYRLSRNPDYLGQALLAAGLGLLFAPAWVLVALVPALGLVRYGVIAREESYLERRFGEEYRRYCRRVRRWI